MTLEEYRTMIGPEPPKPLQEARPSEPGTKSRYYYSAEGERLTRGHWIEFPSFRIVDVEFQAWANAEQRCQNPNNASYADYGGRGIRMEFATFQAFMEEIGPKPSPELSLDRIDNDGNYAVGNIRWATNKVQAQNKRPRSRIRKAMLANTARAAYSQDLAWRMRQQESDLAEAGEHSIAITHDHIASQRGAPDARRADGRSAVICAKPMGY